MKTRVKGMLLVLHCPLWVKDGRLFWDSQACNGVERWADSFGSVIVAAPVLPDTLVTSRKAETLRDIASLNQPERFEFVFLPWAYSIPQFLTTYTSTRQLLAGLIERCQYLQFAIGGLVGDWAAIAALEAHKQGRTYAIHTDRVEHQVVFNLAQQKGLKGWLKAYVSSPLMAQLERFVIERASLGLWHGMDCYAAYSPFCQANYVIHDVHTKPEDIISPDLLTAKAQQALTDPVLRICYAGRMSAMKAPLDWVRAIGAARDLGVNLRATWLGEGELMAQVKALVTELNLEEQVELTGFERDRQKVLETVRRSHLMAFTHITPESPRCLIEALVSGTPLVGYDSKYVEDLTSQEGGGALVPIHNWRTLGATIAELYHDRARLAQLIQSAGSSGTHFSDERVFRERSELIKKQLTSPYRPTELQGDRCSMVWRRG